MVEKERAIGTLKEYLCAMCAYGSQNMETCDIRGCDNRDAIRVLEQELLCHEDKVKMLDKIKAEIKGKYRVILKGTPKDDWAVRWSDCVDEVLQIIDKYKEE